MRKISTITLAMPLGMGTVNCYLLETPAGHLLIDTGVPAGRKELLAHLEQNGCTPDSLKLVLITHGDVDHLGNAACLRNAFGARLAMHKADSAMAERGDMFANRRKPNAIIKVLLPLLLGLRRSERFTPDLFVEEGSSLLEYGLDAKVISLPGHSLGSIGILTSGGELFCGDLFENTKKPDLNTIMDDAAAAKASLTRLAGMKISTVYPGHGQTFSWEQLRDADRT